MATTILLSVSVSLTTLDGHISDSLVKNSPAMQKTWVRSLSWEGPLEEGMATRCSLFVAISSCWMIHAFYVTPYRLSSMYYPLILVYLSSQIPVCFPFLFIWPSLSSFWNNCSLLTKSALNARSIIQALIFKQNPRVVFEAGPMVYLPYAIEIIHCLSLFYFVFIQFCTTWVWYGTVSLSTSKLTIPAGEV